MKVYLMFKDRDFDPDWNQPWNEYDLVQDLQIDTVVSVMAAGDPFYHHVARNALLASTANGTDIIYYRQAVLKDCLKNLSTVQRLYKLAISVTGEKETSHWASNLNLSPRSLLSRAVETLQLFLGTLRELRAIADQDADKFESEGFKAFFTRIREEINSEYLGEIEEHLKGLNLQDEVLIGAQLGKGDRGSDYTVLQTADDGKNWLERTFRKGSKTHSFRINDQDENAVRQLAELRNRGINSVANATAQSAEHIFNFFVMVRTEIAFYLGCANLSAYLAEMDEPTCFPVPAESAERKFSAQEIYDISLALSSGQKVVANTINADTKNLIIVTGANKGGKTTFLRSVGLSQLMMHCGMFVPASSFTANLCTGLFTHFKHKEDVSMESGRLDDELSRMSQIADRLSPDSLVLLNEAFASTNEREGSQIAKQIVSALSESQIKIFFVSHLYQFTQEIIEEKTEDTLFLRAERKPDGSRTFRLSEGDPLETSYGADLYDKIFTTEEREINAEVQ